MEIQNTMEVLKDEPGLKVIYINGPDRKYIEIMKTISYHDHVYTQPSFFEHYIKELVDYIHRNYDIIKINNRLFRVSIICSNNFYTESNIITDEIRLKLDIDVIPITLESVDDLL